MSIKVAALTMIYNEPEYLPLWLRYYGQQLGAANCFVIDHGSDDDLTRWVGCENIFRLPRTPQDEVKRVQSMSCVAEMLLNYYDAVIYIDVDEFIVAKPTKYKSLLHFCQETTEAVVAVVGLNLHHLLGEEDDLDLSRPVLKQRRWVRFVAPMCKPSIVKVPIKWGRGFHSSNKPSVFEDVYMFHLRYFDLKIGLDRLRRTRTLARATAADIVAASHQRVQDDEFRSMMLAVSKMNKLDSVSFATSAEPLASLLPKVITLDSRGINLEVRGNELWRVPDEFSQAF
jgi:hypothetical protein